MSWLSRLVRDLIAMRPAPSFLEKRFLVREMLEGILAESHRSAERASVSSAHPFVSIDSDLPEGAYQISVRADTSALAKVEGELVVYAAVVGLTGGGLPVQLLPESNGSAKTYPLKLDVPWDEELSPSKESRRAVLVLRPGPEPTLELVPLPVSEALFSFAVPLDVLEFSASESKWTALGWYPMDSLRPSIMGSTKEDDRLAQSIDGLISRLQERLDKSVAPRLLMLTQVLLELSIQIRGLGRDLRGLHETLEKARRIVVGCLELYPSLDGDDGPRKAGVWRISERDRLTVGRYFALPVRESVRDLMDSVERLTELAEGHNWRGDVSLVERAEWGDRFPIQTSEYGVEDYYVQGKFQSNGGEVVLPDFDIAPSDSKDDVILVSIEGIAGTHASVPLDFTVREQGQSVQSSVWVDPIDTWSNFVWGVKLERKPGAQFRVSLRNREHRNQWKLEALCLRRA